MRVIGLMSGTSLDGVDGVLVVADATFYRVPDRLVFSNQSTLYGSHPVSFHVFLRVRPRTSAMGLMWNMLMPDLATH